LLKKFVNFDAQKQYQMADWRVRPLPQELFDYARSDTHYLLYIFDCMRNELIERSNLALPNHEGDKLWDVLQKSSETALQRYEHPVYDFELGQGLSGWYKMLSRTPALFTKEQFSVFRAVHKWRDDVAREQDDSVHFIMPNHQIFSIAREMPASRAVLLGIAQPTSQTLRLRADELAGVIATAKNAGKDGPEMLEVLNKIEPHSSTGVAKKDTASHSVAAFVPNESSSIPANAASSVNGSVLPIRAAESAFWGGTFPVSGQHHIQRREMSSASNAVQLSIPLPTLTAEIFADPASTATSTPTKPPEPAPVSESPAEDLDDVFVLKELSKKRKRTADLDGVAAQSDEVAIPNEEVERLREKAERKKAKKEAKRAEKKARKAAEASNENGTQENDDSVTEEQPFDYTTAPSILNPPRESREDMKARRKKEVNPYAKALDTPKGLPRSQRERAGRSMTYR
jgi:exosome complex exonuclease RRP6